MHVATTHVSADVDGVASLVAVGLLHGPLQLVLPGSMDRTARRFWSDHADQLPPLLSLKALRRGLVSDPGGRLLLVDCARAERIGELGELISRFDEVLAFDTHPAEDGDLPRVSLPRAGACVSALVLRLQAAGVQPTSTQAGLFLVGIHVDTGHFTYAGTTDIDHRAAALCLAWGAPVEWPARYAPRGFTARQLRLLESMAGSLSRVPVGDHTVALTTLELSGYVPDLSVLLAQLREAEGWPVAVLIAASPGRISVIGRSDGSLDLGAALGALGGGGHADAASAVLHGLSLRDARGLVIDTLRSRVQPRLRVGDVAVRRFVSVRVGTSVRRVADELHRHRINALPISAIEADCERWVGQVNRQEVEAALRHGLGDRPVGEVSAQAPAWVDPDASLGQARARLLSSPGRLVMVGRPPCEAVGILTRTAVLRLMAEEVPHASASRPPGRDTVTQMLRRNLGDALDTVCALGRIASQQGATLYLVGGGVRDVFLDRGTRDIDLVTEGYAPDIAKAMRAAGGGRVAEHPPFGTAHYQSPGGHLIDIASARSEYYASPGALPQVQHAGLRQDLYRRDFTLNAIAISVLPDDFGAVRDPFGGLDDLRHGVLRVLHGLSFHDDPTRAWRAARFAARLDFHLSADTAALMRSALRAGVFAQVTLERLGHELDLILDSRQVVQAFRLLRRWRLLTVLHPDLQVGRPFLDQMAALIEARQQVIGLSVGPVPSQADVLWLHLAGALDAGGRRDRVRLVPGGRARHRRWLRGGQPVSVALEQLARARDPATAARALEELDPVERISALGLARDPAVSDWIRWWEREGRHVRSQVNGRDLIALGVAPGPALGRGLRAALDVARSGGDRQAQLEAAERVLRD